ncbi:MAG: ribosome maturation factor RimP [Leadbetterella sp.]
MSLKSIILPLIEAYIQEPYYLVGVHISESKIRNKVLVLVDTDAGIQIDECGKISWELGEILDDKVEDKYTLEVSSPGVDTSLKFPRQYKKNLGRTLKLTLEDGSELKGKILEATDISIILVPEAKKKQVLENKQIEYSTIKDAKVVISFK